MMELLSIHENEQLNTAFQDYPDCGIIIGMTLDYYKRIGYHEPWIGYFARLGGEIVGSAGFKGKPRDGKIEIAYGTFPQHEGKGVATEICRQMVLLSLKTDPSVRVTARTLPEENASARVLRKNGFTLLGIVWDEEDGDVWEWELVKTQP